MGEITATEIQAAADIIRRQECPFCDYEGPSEIIDFGEVFAIEPLRPVVPGHMLFIPRLHVDLRKGVERMSRTQMLQAGYAFQMAMEHIWLNGIQANIIQSTGEAATQTVFHLHVHVVPRVEGDGLMLPWS